LLQKAKLVEQIFLAQFVQQFGQNVKEQPQFDRIDHSARLVDIRGPHKHDPFANVESTR